MKKLIHKSFLLILLILGVAAAFGTETGSGLLKGTGHGYWADEKIDPLILEAMADPEIAVPSRALFGAATFARDHNRLLKTDQEGEVQVYLRLSDEPTDALVNELQGYGVRVEQVEEKLRLIQGWIAPDQLSAVSQLAYLKRITAPNYAFKRIGSATTEGDKILKTDELRDLGINGANVRVGVISIGVDNVAEAQASGDLPSVEILSSAPDGGDEGTALLEIVHDVAPAADLGFCEAHTSLEFIQCIRDLKATFQADVIVDDLGYFLSPYFEDGPLADEVAQAMREGVVYVSSAGNSAERHYEGNYLDSGGSAAFHDFGAAAGTASDTGLDVRVAPGAIALFFLQWNDPFGGSGNDYDLGLYDQTGAAIALSTRIQDGDDDPYEFAGVINLGSTWGRLEARVEKYDGQDRRLEMYMWSNHGAVRFEEYNVSAGSIFGHTAVPGVLAVGAIAAEDPAHDTIQPFSSRGPAELFFPVHQIRNKPDLTAIDGVSVSGAGNFPTTFYGTSAAAPHVAGAAALLKSARPGATAAQINTALTSTAVDLGNTGFDFTFGAGRVDALAAESELAAPEITANGAADSVNISVKETLSINVSLASSDQVKPIADWWIVAGTPWGEWYYYVYPGKWSNAGIALDNVECAYAGRPFDVAGFEVLNIRGLSEGRYNFYFGIDMQSNGLIDGPLYYDGVSVNLTN